MKNINRVFVFCILFFITNCSAYPNSAQEADRVGKLPGQDFNVTFAHYSGYVTVKERTGRRFFYWFFEAVEDPSSKPLVLWLTGGPGCSSIAFGEAAEIGPFFPNSDGRSIRFNPHTWIHAANIIFLESPTGAGFSHSNTAYDHLINGDKRTAEDNYSFMLRWLRRFPQYRKNDFYIVGDGYAGHFVPHLSHIILKRNVQRCEKINLKGLMIGNPLIDDHHDQVGRFDFLYTIGMISRRGHDMLKRNCAHQRYLNFSRECRYAHSFAAAEMGHVNPYSVFSPACTRRGSTSNLFDTERWPVGLLNGFYDPCTIQYSTAYFNLPAVRKALHVRGPLKWLACNHNVRRTWKDSSVTVLHTIQNLTSARLRIWVYSGNTDGVIPVTSTRYSIRALKVQPVSPFRPWYQDGQVAGWIQRFHGLTFVVVRGAGHYVPILKPKEALTLFKAFLPGKSLASTDQFSDT